MSLKQSALGRNGVRLAGGSAEPVVSADALLNAIPAELVETVRPLLPVGYEAVAAAYRQATAALTAHDLTEHYTEGLAFFHETFVPYVTRLLHDLSGGIWDLTDYVAFAAGSDVDLITHVVEAVASQEPVRCFPGDWGGFQVGCTQVRNIRWQVNSRHTLACLCVPSVRNGHVTDAMLAFLTSAATCLLNLNLFPTLTAGERRDLAQRLRPVLQKSLLSISFSRGFGLTASQLGLLLIRRDHPWVKRFKTQWKWFTYFYNAIAARAFMALDVATLQAVDEQRRAWVSEWLRHRGLPVVESGSYYVKAFRVEEAVPARLQPLVRDHLVRLCLKPPQL